MLLVHIAGHADLGAPSPFEDPDEIGPLRAEELENCMTPHEAARHLFDLSFTRTPSHENTDAAHSPRPGSALRKELNNLHRQLAALQNKIRNEKQFNLQVAMNTQAKQLKNLITEQEQKLTKIVSV